MNKAILAVLGLVALIAVLAIASIGQYNSVQTVGIQKETVIVKTNNQNTIALNQMASSIYNSVQIANLKSAQMDKIIKDAITGRYSLGSSAKPSSGTLFSAITEAYPTLDLSAYDEIIQYVQKKRDEYTALQDGLQSQLADFQQWQKSGFPHALFVQMIGFPDKNLVCQNDQGQKLFGSSCEDYLLTISQPNGSNNGGGQRPLPIPGLDD